MLRPALLAAGLTAAFPVHADSQLDALRVELQELKSAYEARIQALEARLASIEAPARDVQASAGPDSRTAAFNLDIALVLQGRYAHLEDLPARRIAGFLPNGTPEAASRGFSADESELIMAASVDPYFRGYFNAVLDDDTVSVKEAWFQALALGQGLALKGGRFRSGIGYQNEQHPHAWDFASNNLMYEALFGEGYGNHGLQLKWVAPTGLYTELGAEIGRGANFPGTDRNRNGIGSYALFGHLGGDVGVSHS